MGLENSLIIVSVYLKVATRNLVLYETSIIYVINTAL